MRANPEPNPGKLKDSGNCASLDSHGQISDRHEPWVSEIVFPEELTRKMKLLVLPGKL